MRQENSPRRKMRMEEKHTEGNRGGFPAKEAAGADPEERRKSYQRFCETGQAAKKLEIALEAYLSMAGAGVRTGREFADYERYLQFRRRPALELLIRRDDLEGLRLFAARGWISCREASGYLDLAVREGCRESQLWLLRYIRGLPEAGAAGEQNPEEAGNVRKSEENAAEGNLAETMNVENLAEAAAAGNPAETMAVENSAEAADTGHPEETMDVGKSEETATTGNPAEAPAVEKSAEAAVAGGSEKTVAVENPAEAVVAGELTKATDAGLPGTGESAEVTDAELLKEHLCREILQTMTDFLQNCMASFSSAFSLLEWKPSGEYPEWGTDGHFFFCPADLLMEEFLKGVEALGRRYLHTLCHCMFLHMLGEGGEHELTETWDLACDLAAEWAVDAMGICPVDRERRRKRDGWYREISPDGQVSAVAAQRWLQSRSPEEIEEIGREVQVDSHRFWRERKEDAGSLAGRWKPAVLLVARQQGEEKRRPGTRKGDRTAEVVLQDTGRGDYRKFLERLFVCREEMQVDPDSIDYIPYLYGLEHYGDVLLMEPLETTETSRLEEFVIAIDTSGSCSGAVVRRFLEETYGILLRRENFFRKMNVHLIQCDSMIQDHRKVTCEREWKDYMAHLKIQGLGGTDFTPVFRLVDQMLEKKEIRKLKGLLYFTDGDGIYPNRKPAYETAFVFPWKRPEKQQAPGWAWKLYLPDAMER